ncbi:MAG: hypothetical protein JJU13_13565 [Balneolaceae bacterium]|nr:hypothetical protein [Balneolaceae bacterium]
MISTIRLLLLMTGCLWLIIACSEPEPPPQSRELPEGTVEALFHHLDRYAEWDLISDDLLPFQTFHTQGMTKWNGYYFLSSVEIKERTETINGISRFDRTPGEGEGHLFKFDENGELVQSITISEGRMYHPGGIDYGGGYIWVPVAEYRPNSRTVVYRVDPETMEAEEVFRFSDHIGSVIFDAGQQVLHGYNWGSRRVYSWELEDDLMLSDPVQRRAPEFKINSQFYIDYQDCQYLGNDLAICSGLSSYKGIQIGGIELINLITLQPEYQVPVEEFTDGENPRVMTQNPFFVQSLEDKLEFHFIPEDDESRHYIYEVSSFRPISCRF